ncbi:MAG: hypothetical protein AAGI11_14530 [Pseudomonadota bacterium]
MRVPLSAACNPAALVFALALLTACASEMSEPDLVSKSPAPAGNTDFSGAWELDYSRSDNIQMELNRLVRELQRQQERRNASGNMNRSTSGVAIGGTGTNSGSSVIGLAEMADLVTQSTLLDIDQEANFIQVKREGNFALACEYFGGTPTVVETPMGSEICGWSGHQMVFHIALPEGLTIRHVMTLGGSGQNLNIATTVRSDYVSWPFTLNRVYRRYDPEAGGVRCEQTLTRGRVCTTEARPE